MNVIDLSQHNTITNWKLVKQTVDGIILRVAYRGYGTGKIAIDNKFKTYASACKSEGIPFGIYFFSQAISEKEAIEEAEYCVKYANEVGVTIPYIYFDSEMSGTKDKSGRADSLSKDLRTRCAVAFCNRINQLGYKGGVYASESWYSTNLDFAKIKDYSIWVANYGVNNGKQNKKPTTAKLDMWQYTSKAKPNYATGYIDHNIAYIDLTNKEINSKPQNKPVENTSTGKGIVKGDKVKIVDKALYYANTTGKVKIPQYVKQRVHTVDKIDNDKVRLKEIWSWVMLSDLERV